MPVILGIAVWFGLHYFFIAEEIAYRTVANTCSKDNQVECRCVARIMLADARFDAALWTSTLGTFKVGLNQAMIAAKARGKAECR